MSERCPNPDSILRNFSVTNFRDGRLGIAAVTKDNGRVVMTKQVGPNGTPLPGDTSTNSWTSWEDMGGHDLRNVTARESLDHRLELVAHGADAIVYHRYEAAPNNWTEWAPISAEKVCGPVQFFASKAGRMEIVARRCPAGEIVHVAQVAPNGGWATTWSQLVPNSPGAEMVPSPWRSAPTVSSAFSTIDCSAAGSSVVKPNSVNTLPPQWSEWVKVSDGN